MALGHNTDLMDARNSNGGTNCALPGVINLFYRFSFRERGKKKKKLNHSIHHSRFNSIQQMTTNPQWTSIKQNKQKHKSDHF